MAGRRTRDGEKSDRRNQRNKERERHERKRERESPGVFVIVRGGSKREERPKSWGGRETCWR